jgi:cell division protein FtsW (lipid II flippase)
MSEKSVHYTNKVTSYVRSKEAKKFVAEELHYHLEQETKGLKDAGLSEQDAEEKAIQQMGSAERLGQDMNKLHRPRVDWVMIGMIMFISLMGILPTLNVSNELYNNADYYFTRKVIYLILGAAITIAFMFFDYRRLRSLKWVIFAFTTFILLALTLFPNTILNGAAYFRVAGLTVDSTTAVTAFVLCLVILLGDANAKFWRILPVFAITLYALMIIPDITAVFVYTVTVTVLLWFRFKRKRKYILWGYLGAALFMGLMVTNAQPYQLERIYAFVNPEKYSDTSGYTYLRNEELLEQGGWFGENGGTESIMAPHTDFAFTTITYNYGWIAGGLLIIIGLFIMVRMIRKIKTIKDPFGQVIIIGGVTLFSTQFLYNIGMMKGLLPITGMFLPFISYGLNPTLQTSIVMGLFLSVYRRKDFVASREIGGWNKI